MKELIIYVRAKYTRIDYYGSKILTIDNPEQELAIILKETFSDIPLICVNQYKGKSNPIYYLEELDESDHRKIKRTTIEDPHLEQYDFIYLLAHHDSVEVEKRVTHVIKCFKEDAHIFPILDDAYGRDSSRQYYYYKKEYPNRNIWPPYVISGSASDRYVLEGLFPIIKAMRSHIVLKGNYHFPNLFSDARVPLDLDKLYSSCHAEFYYFGLVFDINKEEQNTAIINKIFHYSSNKDARITYYWNVYIRHDDKDIKERINKLGNINRHYQGNYIDMVSFEYDRNHIEDMFKAINPLIKEGFIKHIGISNISLDDLKELINKEYKITAVMLDIDLNNLPYEYLTFLKENNIIPIVNFDISKYDEEPIFKDIAKKIDAYVDYFKKRIDTRLIILLYLISKGISINLNYDVDSETYWNYFKWFVLTNEEIKEIDNYLKKD